MHMRAASLHALPGCCLQALSVKELFAIARVAQQDRRLPGFRAQQWYFFVIAEFFLMGRWVALAPGGRGCCFPFGFR